MKNSLSGSPVKRLVFRTRFVYCTFYCTYTLHLALPFGYISSMRGNLLPCTLWDPQEVRLVVSHSFINITFFFGVPFLALRYYFLALLSLFLLSLLSSTI